MPDHWLFSRSRSWAMLDCPAVVFGGGLADSSDAFLTVLFPSPPLAGVVPAGVGVFLSVLVAADFWVGDALEPAFPAFPPPFPLGFALEMLFFGCEVGDRCFMPCCVGLKECSRRRAGQCSSSSSPPHAPPPRSSQPPVWECSPSRTTPCRCS